MSQPPSGKAASTPPARSATRLLVNALKIAIAVIGVWLVVRGVHWNDSAIVQKDNPIRAVTLLADVEVRVLSQSATPRGDILLQVQFPSNPVHLRVNTATGVRDVDMVIAEDAIVPGTNQPLNLPREIELDAAHFVKDHDQIIHDGLRSIGVRASSKWHLLLCAWLLLGIPFVITAIRWRGLMVPQGIRMPLGKCLQLTFVGQFYSIMLPGITGGDLVKIVYAARLTGSKTKSLITVILDRIIGMVSLMAIAGTSAGIQLLRNQQQGLPRDGTLLNVFLMIVALLAAFAIGCIVYFSTRLRRLIGIEWFIEHYRELSDADQADSTEHQKLERLFRVMNVSVLVLAVAAAVVLAILRWQVQLPWALQNSVLVIIAITAASAAALVALGGLLLHNTLVRRATPLMRKVIALILGIDETLQVYRGHMGLLAWAFFISLISQLSLPLSAWLSGLAFGMTAPVTYYLAYVPLAVLAASLPISPPQGLGFLDYVLKHFFVDRGAATTSQVFALTQSVRFFPILWNLMGAYWVITGQYSRKSDTAEPAIAPPVTQPVP